MGLKLDTLDICPPPVRIGVELNSKKFSQRSLYSPLTVKKSWHFHSFSPASSTDIKRRKDSLRSWYRFTRVKLNFSEETTRKWRRGWVGETPFFLSNKSWRVKVSVCRGNGIIPSGKVEIIKISNFQTGVRRQKTYDSAAWDGQCRGFPIERANFAPTSNLENWKPLKKKGKKEKLFPLWCLVASPKNNFLSYDHSTVAWLRVRARGCGLLKGFRDSVFFFLSFLSFFSVTEEDLEIVRITESNMEECK